MSIAQTNLREPERVDWDNYGKSYVPPPVVRDEKGDFIRFSGTVEANETDGDDGYLNYTLDFKVAGNESLRLRTWASTKPFTKNDKPIKGNPSKLGNYLRAAGAQAKPQLNDEYRATVKSVAGRKVSFTMDWEAKNKETGEVVKGYNAFPDDPQRPGQKKSILKRGDVINVLDNKGNIIGTREVESEVLFANARFRYFVDPLPKVVG